MEPLQDRCRQEGCEGSRGRFTSLCDEHHREQLIRVGLERETPPDPCEVLAGRCRQVIRASGSGAITHDEVIASLFDLLVHAGAQGLERCWGPCLDATPDEVVAGLRVRGGPPGAALFHPLPTPDAARHEAERVALGVQARLLRSLGEWVPPGEREVEIRVPAISGGWLVWFVRWLVADGAPVQADQPVCELECGGVLGNVPEASLDFPAPASGVLERGEVVEGASVQWGQVLGRIRPG